jgi:hypothetical protein
MLEPGAEPARRSSTARVAAAIASVLAVATALVLFVSGPRDLAMDAVDIGRVTCLGETRVLTPIVLAHPDGVDLLVKTDDDGAKLSIQTADGGSIGFEVARGAGSPHAVHVRLAPGEINIRCGTSARVANGPALDVVDPAGLWHEDRLACSRDFEERGSFEFHPSLTSLPDAIARVVPGVLASDEISYAGYPFTRGSNPSRSFRVVRDGRVVARFELAASGQRQSMNALYSCEDSGIGGE